MSAVWPIFTLYRTERPVIVNPAAVAFVAARTNGPEGGAVIRLVGDSYPIEVMEPWDEVANRLNYPSTIETEKKP